MSGNSLRLQSRYKGDDRSYLHRGIATRAFERHFQLADFVEVRSADFDSGLLTITLQRVVPEGMKPRRIEIGGGSDVPKLEDRQAA